MSLPGPPPLAPQLEFLCRLEVTLDPIKEMGQGHAGQRRIIPIIGGTVSGKFPKHGALTEVINYGFRNGPTELIAALANGEPVDPKDCCMRTQARLASGHPKYRWLNQRLFFGTGMRCPNQVVVDLFKFIKRHFFQPSLARSKK